MKRIDIRYCQAWNYLPRATRVAALIKAETGLDPTVTVGKRGEFSVWVGDQTVAKKSIFGFPSDDDVVSAVQQALAAGKGA